MNVLIGLVAGLAPVASPAIAQCELHVWPTNEYYATFHGAAPVFLGYGTGIQMYQSPLEQARAAMRILLPEEEQTRLIEEQTPSPASPIRGYKIIVHEAPGKSRFANWLDKHIGDGPRETASTSPCYSELHLVALTVYKTAIYKQLQTIYVYRSFGSSPTAVKTVRDAARTDPGSLRTSRAKQTTEAAFDLKSAFARSIGKIFENRKLTVR